MSDFDWNKKNSAPIGTPENPEIIDPGGASNSERDVGGSHQSTGSRRRFTFRGGVFSQPGSPSNAQTSGTAPAGRIARGFQILMWMVYLAAPALLFDSIWFWLYEMGKGDGGFFAWFLLILISPPAFLLTVVAMLVNSFLLLLFIANLLGRPIAENPAGMIRFIKLR